MVILYIGPEVLMPLASILAAITGVLLLFWRKVVAAAKALYRILRQLVSTLFTG